MEGNRETRPRRSTNHIAIRTAIPADFPFVSALQADNSNQLGFLPHTAIAEYIQAGHILIATINGTRVGYLAGRHELRWQPLLRPITQIAVIPGAQRLGIATALIAHHTHKAIVNKQLGLQAICRATLPANHLFAACGFIHITYLTPPTARNVPLICWRLPLTSKIPIWFACPPSRAGHHAKKAKQPERTAVQHARHNHQRWSLPTTTRPAHPTERKAENTNSKGNTQREGSKKA